MRVERRPAAIATGRRKREEEAVKVAEYEPAPGAPGSFLGFLAYMRAVLRSLSSVWRSSLLPHLT